MNDNDKFKKFFGFGGGSEEKEASHEKGMEPVADQEALEKANAIAAEWNDKYLALTADFQNYKKRVDLDRAEWSFEAQKKVFLGLLDIVDNFERALEQERKRENAEDVTWLAGFEMIYQSIEKLMQKFGIQKITDFSSFNPKYHEALVQVESADHKSGDIVQVLQTGYTMQDKVIRPATVSVAK
jgi:molecular chaperone GrpE